MLDECGDQACRVHLVHTGPQCSFTIRCRRINQYSRHWIAVYWIAGINAFCKRGTGVPALNCELPYQCVCKCMHHHISDARVAVVRVEVFADPPRLVPLFKLSFVSGIFHYPALNRGFRKLEKDPFATCFACWEPGWVFARYYCTVVGR